MIYQDFLSTSTYYRSRLGWDWINDPIMGVIADRTNTKMGKFRPWKLGHRSTGLLFSAGTFSQKIGWSIGPAVAMYLLSYFGFVANQEQTPETIYGLRLIMSWIPAGAAALTGVVAFFYKIDAVMECELEAALEEEEKPLS